MSAAEVWPRPPVPAPAPVRAQPARFLRSELRLIFGRRRNLAGLAVLAAVPVLIARRGPASSPGAEAAAGPDFFVGDHRQRAVRGPRRADLELPLFLPLAVGAISGDAVAGEANLGTLRYLLTVPVGADPAAGR